VHSKTACCSGGRPHREICLRIVSFVADADEAAGVQLLQLAVDGAGAKARKSTFSAWRADRAPKQELQQLQHNVQHLIVGMACEHQQLRSAAAAQEEVRGGVQATEQGLVVVLQGPGAVQPAVAQQPAAGVGATEDPKRPLPSSPGCLADGEPAPKRQRT
jgi:hypothetical protein